MWHRHLADLAGAGSGDPLDARSFPLVQEGLRLFDVQLTLLRTREDVTYD